MIDKQQIDNAIGAHGMWKARLYQAIHTGKSEFQPEKVKVDNLCDFGKWFYTLLPTERSSPKGKTIQDLHAKFHAEAARVLDLALTGKKQEAEIAIGLGSNFANLSAALTQQMMAWKNESVK